MQRQVKFIAKVLEPSTIKICFNHQTVFQGFLNPTKNIESVCEWITDTSLFGKIPMQIYVSQGKIVWADLHMNYTGVKLAFPGSQSLGYQRVKPKDFFSPPGSGELKFDVHIDGEPQVVNREHHEYGAWHYTIALGQTLDCAYYIDRKRTLIFDVRD